jgi:hypothetical protein
MFQTWYFQTSVKTLLEGSVQRGVFDRCKKSVNGRDTDLPEEIEELVRHILKFEENSNFSYNACFHNANWL